MTDINRLEVAIRELSSKGSPGHKESDQENSRPKNLMVIDPITYVYNREFFELQLVVQLSIAARQRGLLVLYVVKVEGLDPLNDSGSQESTQTALRKFAKCLSALFRRGTDFIARTAENQFMVLTLTMSEEQAQAYLPAIRNRLGDWDDNLRCQVILYPYKPKPTEKTSAADLIESINELHPEIRP